MPHAAHARYYVQQLQGLQKRDRLRLLGERLQASANDPTTDSDELIGEALRALGGLQSGRAANDLIDAAAASNSTIHGRKRRRRKPGWRGWIQNWRAGFGRGSWWWWLADRAAGNLVCSRKFSRTRQQPGGRGLFAALKWARASWLGVP